jgi:hypothetical protein
MRFRSVNAAIKWAMEMKSREIVTTSRFGSVSSGGELNAQELHAQAVYILIEIGKLPYAERAAVAIKFDVPRIETAMALADEIGYCADRLAIDCVMAYQADKPSIRAMADKHKRSTGTIQATRKRVFDKLDPIYRRAMAHMELRLADLIEKAA